MIEYCVVKEKLSANVEIKVNNLIEQGWVPIGGICMCPATFRIRPETGRDDGFDSFYSMQAMIRRRSV